MFPPVVLRGYIFFVKNRKDRPRHDFLPRAILYDRGTTLLRQFLAKLPSLPGKYRACAVTGAPAAGYAFFLLGQAHFHALCRSRTKPHHRRNSGTMFPRAAGACFQPVAGSLSAVRGGVLFPSKFLGILMYFILYPLCPRLVKRVPPPCQPGFQALQGEIPT